MLNDTLISANYPFRMTKNFLDYIPHTTNVPMYRHLAMQSCCVLHLKSYALLISKHQRRAFSFAICPLYHVDIHVCKGNNSVSTYIMISRWTVWRSNSAFTPCTSLWSGPNLGPTQPLSLKVPQRFLTGVK